MPKEGRDSTWEGLNRGEWRLTVQLSGIRYVYETL